MNSLFPHLEKMIISWVLILKELFTSNIIFIYLFFIIFFFFFFLGYGSTEYK